MRILRIFLFLSLVFLIAFWVSRLLTRTEPPVLSDPPKLYSNQTRDDLRLYHKNAIDQAKESVTLIIYTLTDPLIISALKKKAKEGVKVVVLTDVKTAKGLDRRLGEDVHLIKRFGSGLMHRKLLLIDGKETWIGSANMTRESLRMHGNLVIGIYDPEMTKMIEEHVNDKMPPYTEFVIGGQRIALSFLPEDDQGVNRLKDLISTATKSVKIAMFTWTRHDLANEVIEAKKRGLDVEVVMDHQQSKGDSGKIYRLLKKNGVDVTLSKGPGLLHHKFLYIDGSVIASGSANWTKAAFKKNDDVYLIIYDMNEQQHKMMEKLWKVISLK